MTYLLRVHARWYPAGARFVVRCGRPDDDQNEVPILTTDGWKPLPEEMRVNPTAEWPAMAWALREFDRHLGSVKSRLDPLGNIILGSVFGRAMMEPRLWEGVVYDETLCDDPRVGWTP